MSWRPPRWSRRAKLTALLTITISAILAAVLVTVVSVVARQAINRRFAELRQEVVAAAAEWHGPSSLDDDVPNTDLAVYDSSGRLLAATTKQPPAFSIGQFVADDKAILGQRVGTLVFEGASPLTETEEGLRELAWILAALWLPISLLVAAATWYGGGLVLRPVTELVESAERLSASADGQFLETSDTGEFAVLASSLNQLISRVRHSASLQEQFASDAAHELRNPLAILRMRIETNLRRDRTAGEHVESQRAMLGQIERLTSIVETLLASARMQAPPANPIRFDISVRAALTSWSSLRDLGGLNLEVDTEECYATVGQDETDVIVANLVDNAARHSSGSATVKISVAKIGPSVVLSIRDYGKGLRQEDKALAFERFYRADEARHRRDGGAGIGLAVVKRIVQSRGGEVEFCDVRPGALVSVSLPAAAAPERLGEEVRAFRG